jgi:2-phospho-L-lactate guanylyltransferase
VSWTLLIPYKGAFNAKSRLRESGVSDDDRKLLADAFLSDVLAAASEVERVSQVIVTTPDPATRVLLESCPCSVIVEPRELDGLNDALAWALAEIGEARNQCAILAADLPFVSAAEIEYALELASQHERSFVSDSAGSGTTLLAMNHTAEFTPAFGEDSRSAHERLGCVELPIPQTSGLRRDVDTLDQLNADHSGIGEFTASVLGALPSR